MSSQPSKCPECASELSYTGYCVRCATWPQVSSGSAKSENLLAGVGSSTQAQEEYLSESLDLILDAQDRTTYAIRSIAIFFLGSVVVSSCAAFCLWFYSIEISRCEYSCSAVSVISYLGWGIFGFGMLGISFFAIRELDRSKPTG
jgi:hypothetical protein